MGRALDHRGEGAAAAERWRSAAAILAPMAERSSSLENLAPWALTLLLQDRTEEARPVVEDLLGRGYRDRELMDLARAKGLTDPWRADRRPRPTRRP